MSKELLFLSEAVESFWLRLTNVGWSTLPLIDLCESYNACQGIPGSAPPGMMAVATRRDPTNCKPRFYISAVKKSDTTEETALRRKLFYERMSLMLPNKEKSEVDRIMEMQDADCILLMLEGLLTLTKRAKEQMKKNQEYTNRVIVGCAAISINLSGDAVLEFTGVVDESVPFSAKKFGNGSQGEFRRRKLGSMLLGACQSLRYFLSGTLLLHVQRLPFGGCEQFLNFNGFEKDQHGEYSLNKPCRGFSWMFLGNKEDHSPNETVATPTSIEITEIIHHKTGDVTRELPNDPDKSPETKKQPSMNVRLTREHSSDTEESEDSTEVHSAGQEEHPDTDLSQIPGDVFDQSNVARGSRHLTENDDTETEEEEPNDMCHVCCSTETDDMGVCVACGHIAHTMCSINLDLKVEGIQALLCITCNEEGFEVDTVKKEVLREIGRREKKPRRLEVDPCNIISDKRGRRAKDKQDAEVPPAPTQTETDLEGNTDIADTTKSKVVRKHHAAMTDEEWLNFLRSLKFIKYTPPLHRAHTTRPGGFAGMGIDGTEVLLKTVWVEHHSGLSEVTFVDEGGDQQLFLNMVKSTVRTWCEIPQFFRDHLSVLCDLEDDPLEVTLFNECCQKHWTKIRYVRGKKLDSGAVIAGYFVLANNDLTEKFRKPPELWIETFLPPQNTGQQHPNIVDAKKTRKWIELSAGSSKDCIRKQPVLKDNAPLVFFRQPGNVESCVFSSLASALMAFGDLVAANVIGDNITASLLHTDRLQFANQLLRTKQLKYVPKIYKRDQLQVLTDISRFATLCILKGDDGATNHAVTVIDNWVFDSNVEKAIPLSKNSLDWCCSTPELSVKWKSVHRALRCVCYHT